MNDKKQYGFLNHTYDSSDIVTEVLYTGDGKTQFADITFNDGKVGVSVKYDKNDYIGIGNGLEYPEDTVVSDIKPRWLIVFEDEGSINALIDILITARNNLIK